MEKASSKRVVLKQMGHEKQNWAFDHVAGEDTSQEEMFRGTKIRQKLQNAGHSVTWNVLY